MSAILFSIYAASTLVSMAAMSIGIGALLVGLFLIREESKLKSTSLQRQYIWISGAIVLACVLSLGVGQLAPVTIGGKTAHSTFADNARDLLKLWYFILPLLWLRALAVVRPQQIFRVWLGAFAVLSIIGVIQYFTGWPRPQEIPNIHPTRYHATGFLGHHLSVASIFIFPFFVALGLAASKKGRHWIGGSPVWIWGTVAVGALGLFLTYSRMLWLALPVGVAVWIYLTFVEKWSLRLKLLGLFAVLFTLWGAWQVPAIHSRFEQKMGVDTRYALWDASIAFFKMRPLTGVGWRKGGELSGAYLIEKTGSDRVFSGHAHNNFLEMLGSTGALGALAWVTWCGWGLIAFWREGRRSVIARALFCAWVVFHLNGLTQVNFWEGKVLHQMMWSMGVLLAINFRKQDYV